MQDFQKRPATSFGPPFMEFSQEEMLAADALIHRYGDGAEEYIARQLWDSGQKKDKTSASRWQSMLQALKRVRELRAKIQHG